VDLAIGGSHRTIGGEQHARIEMTPILGHLGERAAMQPGRMPTGDVGHSRNQRTVEGLGVLPGRVQIEGGCAPQLGEYREVRFLDGAVGLGEHSIDPLVESLVRAAVSLHQGHTNA